MYMYLYKHHNHIMGGHSPIDLLPCCIIVWQILRKRCTFKVNYIYDIAATSWQENKVGDSRGSLGASRACVTQLCWVPRKMLAGQGIVYACAVV